MFLLFNTLTLFVIAFLPRSKHLLISWLQIWSTIMLKPKKIKSVTVSFLFFYLLWSYWTGHHDHIFWMLSFKPVFFQSPLSSSSKGSLFPLSFLPLEWYNFHIWDCWYFSQQSWFKFVIHSAWHLEKAMAPYSCTLAWKIPWMEEPGRLQYMGSLRVRHGWVTSLSLSTFMQWRRKWQPTPVFLPGESQGWGNLVGCHLWGCTDLDTTEMT